MTGMRIKLIPLCIAAMMIAQSTAALAAVDSPESGTSQTNQQQGMEDNLEGSIPQSDLKEEQGLVNARIIVPENLKEMPDVRVVTPEPELGDTQEGSDSESPLLERTKEELDAFEDEMQLEGADRGRELLDKTDRLMEISRKPLTYIQENVPFLTKRNIIFFGRLEVDGARYTSGVLEDDSGFTVRRFRVGLAGQVRPFPGLNYKLEFDLTDGENTLSDAYLSWRSKKWGTIRVGNQKVAQTLSGQTSSLSITFMERPLPVLAFTLQRRLGLGWDTHLKKMGANITIFGKDPNENVGARGWAARAYFNPSRDRFHVIHVGGSFMQLESDDDARIGARPESHVTDS